MSLSLTISRKCMLSMPGYDTRPQGVQRKLENATGAQASRPLPRGQYDASGCDTHPQRVQRKLENTKGAQASRSLRGSFRKSETMMFSRSLKIITTARTVLTLAALSIVLPTVQSAAEAEKVLFEHTWTESNDFGEAYEDAVREYRRNGGEYSFDTTVDQPTKCFSALEGMFSPENVLPQFIKLCYGYRNSAGHIQVVLCILKRDTTITGIKHKDRFGKPSYHFSETKQLVRVIRFKKEAKYPYAAWILEITSDKKKINQGFATWETFLFRNEDTSTDGKAKLLHVEVDTGMTV